jgi:hypothetical protein
MIIKNKIILDYNSPYDFGKNLNKFNIKSQNQKIT